MKKLHFILLILIFLSVSLLTIAKDKPNILVNWGDDIGQSYINTHRMCMMEYQTPYVNRIAKEGIILSDYYSEQSCTAGRSSQLS